MNNFVPIEGRTIPIQMDAEPGGSYFGGAEGGMFQVQWSWNPVSGTGGITGKSWPQDFQTFSGSDIKDLLEKLAQGAINHEEINEAITRYADHKMWYGGWDDFRRTYQNCLVQA